MEVEIFLAPVSQDSPCGPDLEYDPDFTSLEQASQGEPERGIGDEMVPAKDPDWTDIKQRAETLLSRTKDLRVAILLVRAYTYCEGMVGFASSLKLVEEMLVRYWDSVHPALDPAEENDPTMRLNVLESLSRTGPLVSDVQSIKFVSVDSHTRLSVRDILVTLDKLPSISKETVFSPIEIEKIVCAAENEMTVQAMHDAMQTLENIQSFLGEKVGLEYMPGEQQLYDMLKSVLTLCHVVVSESEEARISEVSSQAQLGNEIRSREQAIQMLEMICKFIERTEPTNPASLLIRRAQSLMTKSFIEIIQELAPDGLNQVLNITGLDSDKHSDKN